MRRRRGAGVGWVGEEEAGRRSERPQIGCSVFLCFFCFVSPLTCMHVIWCASVYLAAALGCLVQEFQTQTCLITVSCDRTISCSSTNHSNDNHHHSSSNALCVVVRSASFFFCCCCVRSCTVSLLWFVDARSPLPPLFSQFLLSVLSMECEDLV